MKYLTMALVLLTGCAEAPIKKPEVYVGMSVDDLVVKRAATPAGKQGDKEIYKFISPYAMACTAYFKGGRMVADPYCVDTPESLAKDQAMLDEIDRRHQSDRQFNKGIGGAFQDFAKSGYRPSPPPTLKTHCKTSKDGFGNLITDCE